MKAKQKKRFYVFARLLCCLILSACTSFPHEEAKRQEFETRIISANKFHLFALVREKERNGPWSVFIEGDGHAWASRTQPSSDPTPRNPVALDMALHDTAKNRLYLARPCQYITGGFCESKYWTTHRFAPDVLEAMDQAIDQMTGNAPKHLIGYSGGGAIATLLAARRKDVSGLTTYAGNLDIRAFSAIHHTTPLSGSLNPMDVAPLLKDLPQVHYVGGEDKIIPPSVVKDFIKAQGNMAKSRAHLVVIDDATHSNIGSFVHKRDKQQLITIKR